MKACAGMNLADIAKEADKTLLDEHRASIARQVRHVLGEAYQCSQKVERLEKELASARQQLDKAVERANKVREGDWSVVPEIKPPQAAAQNGDPS